ncbi:DUF3613 domain-containing protein [Achromobacter spanius]|uniref:TapA domain-containing protein n=1 Tax=Achromobacter spanius TaxID=217203 RepID=A0A2S0IA82_9BURK|nr:DUF3613 domain-containing protein [Achromobacter spanius]AVJ28932.1 TapA domain-containing protein [Achromobacter spanius]
MTRSISHALLMLTCAAMAPCAGHAQTNAPLTGGMSAAPAAAESPTAMPDRPVVQQVQTPMPAASPAATATAAPVSSPAPATPEAFGDVTRGLLAAQADGRRAGNALPVLGQVSTAAWNRYVESFKQPIPVWFDRNVEIPSVQ